MKGLQEEFDAMSAELLHQMSEEQRSAVRYIGTSDDIYRKLKQANDSQRHCGVRYGRSQSLWYAFANIPEPFLCAVTRFEDVIHKIPLSFWLCDLIGIPVRQRCSAPYAYSKPKRSGFLDRLKDKLKEAKKAHAAAKSWHLEDIEKGTMTEICAKLGAGFAELTNDQQQERALYIRQKLTDRAPMLTTYFGHEGDD